MAKDIAWSDAKPTKRKSEKKLGGRVTSGASFATVGTNKLTVYRVKKTPKGEVWHAAVNGKRIEAAFVSMNDAKTAAAKAAA